MFSVSPVVATWPATPFVFGNLEKQDQLKKLLTVFGKIKNKRLGSELQAATTVLTTMVRKTNIYGTETVGWDGHQIKVSTCV